MPRKKTLQTRGAHNWKTHPELPGVHEKFDQTHLPENILGLYERVAGIYELSVDDLAPSRDYNVSALGAKANYSKIGHTIRLTPSLVNEPTIRHDPRVHMELGLSLVTLINPDAVIESLSRPGFSHHQGHDEPISMGDAFNYSVRRLGAAFGKNMFSSSLAKAAVKDNESLMPELPPLTTTAALTAGLALGALVGGTLGSGVVGAGVFMGVAYRMQAKRDDAVQNFVKRYGQDGFILLAVENPHNLFQTNFKRIEKKWVDSGQLHPPEDGKKGFLTPLGEDEIRLRMPKSELERRLTAMSKNRGYHPYNPQQ